MKNQIDHDIHVTLASLGRAQPPQGMEQRVLRSLQARKAERQARRGWRWMPAVCVAAALVSAAVVVLIHPSVSPPLAAGHEDAKVMANVPRSAFDSAGQVYPSPMNHRIPMRPVAMTPAADEQLTAQAASFPAPPAPLTQQERLLLSIAHHPTRGEFNLLNPETIEREIAQNDAEFSQFFPPPPPTEIPSAPEETTDEVHPLER